MLGAGGAALKSNRDLRRPHVKNWWRKWSYEIPLAFGDALWDVLVVQFADFLSRLTIRRVLEFVVIALLVMAFVQSLPIDLAILFAGDTLTYLEIAMILRLAAGRELLREMLRLSMRLARRTLQASRTAFNYSISRIARQRERRNTVRLAKPRRRPRKSDDAEGFGWGALAAA
jgi:hypothetical protein